MAYVVEAFLNALPLALLLLTLGPFSRAMDRHALIWSCIVIVSCLDPIVHLRLGASAYVAVFVFVFTLVQLFVFRRYDFVSMYTFRVVFYLYWHVGWGFLRLRWLF